MQVESEQDNSAYFIGAYFNGGQFKGNRLFLVRTVYFMLLQTIEEGSTEKKMLPQRRSGAEELTLRHCASAVMLSCLFFGSGQ